MIATRPDIAFAIHHLSRFGQNYTARHYEALVRLLRYVHTTRNKVIVYKQQKQPLLEAYSDANWAGCPFTRESTSGRIVFFGGSPVSWCSQLQRAVPASSFESELYALTDTVKEVVYQRIFWETLAYQVHYHRPYTATIKPRSRYAPDATPISNACAIFENLSAFWTFEDGILWNNNKMSRLYTAKLMPWSRI